MLSNLRVSVPVQNRPSELLHRYRARDLAMLIPGSVLTQRATGPHCKRRESR